MKTLGGLLAFIGVLVVFGSDYYAKKREMNMDFRIMIKTIGLLSIIAAFYLIVMKG